MPRSGLADIFAAMASEAKDDAVNLPHADIIAKLREVGARYTEPCPFKVGDLVTPIKGANIKGVGDPHLVIDVLQDAQPQWVEDTGSFRHGQRTNLRVLCMMGNAVVPFWNESASYEPYVAPVDQQAA